MSRFFDADDFFRTFEELDIEPYNNFQTADVKEVVHGEWIDKDEDYMIRWTCSNCGRRDTHIYNFCPDCGADMRGGTE